MSIEQVLGVMHESGLVNGYPHQLDGDDDATETEIRKHIVSLAGPGSDPPHGYSRLSGGPNEILSSDRAAALLGEQIMPGRDYRIGFTFTPGYGAHWSMTVILDSDGKVASVVPFHTWD